VGAWLLLGGVALACSGTSFSEGVVGEAGSGGSGSSAGSDSHGGVLNRAGHGNGGSVIGTAGSQPTAGTDAAGADSGGTTSGGTGTGGDVSVGGDVVTAGTASGGSAGTSAMGGAAGTNSGPPVDVVCPKSQPSSGGLCKDGLLCSYGTDLRADCRNLAKCDGGKWSLDKPGCAGLQQCEGVIVGKTCDPNAAACSLDSGVFCVCSACSGAGPCSTDYTWACAGSQGGVACPKSPPNLGQACAADAQCPYGSCATGSNITATCKDSTWSWEHNLCPLAVQ
jgi:hypothetical protein